MNKPLEIPDEYRQLDFFAGDLVDIATRDKREMMNKPFFALSPKRFEPMEYASATTDIIIAGAKPYGIATIKDKDILIWIISQMVEKRDRGKKVEQKIRFHAYDLLRGIFRSTTGRNYQLLEQSLLRLRTTTIIVTMRDPKTGKKQVTSPFNWLYFKLIYDDREHVSEIEAVLPDWVYQSIIKQGNVLTLDRRYLLLSSNLERALYEIARVHVGNGNKQNKGQWKFRMRELYERTGSTARFSDFAIKARKCVERDRLPEYCMGIEHKDGEEWVVFVRRNYLAPEDERYEAERISK